MKFIIDFVNDTLQEEINSYLETNNITVLKTYNTFEKVYFIESSQNPPNTSIVDSIIDDDLTIISPLTYEVFNSDSLTTYSSTSISTSDKKDWWKIFSSNAPEFDVPTIDFPRQGVKSLIYLVDGGIKLDHTEFSNANIENLWSFTNNFNDTSGHGTALASVMIGNTCGLSDAKLLNVKIYDVNQDTKQSDLLSAFDAIYQHYLGFQNLIPIVNCSWSIAKNSYIEQKLQFLINLGMYVVAAAGNSGVTIQNVTPASMQDVITIGSYNSDLLPSNFSNYSNPSIISNTQQPTNTGQLDGWAPGEEIWVASLNGLYNYASGTSLSSAIVASALAYNMDTYCYADPALYLYWKNLKTDVVSRCLSRPELLMLSETYTDSKSVICTFGNKNTKTTVPTPYYEIIFGGLRTQEFISLNFFNPSKVKTVTFNEELPSWVYMLDAGVIHLSNTIIPTDDSVNVHDFNFTLTNTDDIVTSGVIRVIVVGRGNTQSEIFLPDLNITVKLLGYSFSCLSGVSCSGLDYEGDSCYDDCWMSSSWSMCWGYMYCKGVYVGIGNEQPWSCYCN